MSKIDRLLVLVLVLGIWALVLKPTETNAHHDYSTISCNWAFSSGSGSVGRRGHVEIDDVSGSVNCSLL